MGVGETLWVPLRTHEHPTGAHTGTPRGSGYVKFYFRSRTLSLRLPGSLTTRRVVATLRLMRTRVYVYVAILALLTEN